MKSVTLKDGVVIEFYKVSRNTSGYNCVTVSSAWSMDLSHPFIACCSNPSDPVVLSKLRAQKRHCWQGGAYSDAREAAYVIGLFRIDPIGIDEYLAEHKVYTDFPDDLYDLPVFLSLEDAKLSLTDPVIKTKSPATNKPIIRKTKLKLEDVMGAVGRAIKDIKDKNVKVIREEVIKNFGNFSSETDAVAFVLNMLSAT